jgi:mannose-6-phosphate isomerase
MLDIDERLSVQVHPSDEIALERYDSLGKTEFWYVMEADPNAVVYMGFKRDITPQEFFEACKNQTAKDLMNEYHPKKGDCFLVKAGTVHAACGGIVIAEIQEQSDLTFRLYDWGREHNPATARKMHLEEAIDCIDYNKYKESECLMREVKENVMVADCKQFTINNIALKDTYHVYPENYNSFIIYICTEGAAMIQAGDQTYDLVKGEMIMIPSSMEDFFISPKDINTNLLESYIKEIREPEDSYVEDAQ